MSKIGRKPIALDKVQVDVKGQEVHYKGPNSSGIHELPVQLIARVEDGFLLLELKSENDKKLTRRELNRIWGLHRALLSNKIHGANTDFEENIQIVGLGYKAVQSGDKLVFSLGYSHKIDFPLPKGVAVVIDKSGQKLAFKSADKELVGHVCSMVKSLRPPEPYKGTGVKLATDVIARKAGKAKSS